MMNKKAWVTLGVVLIFLGGGVGIIATTAWDEPQTPVVVQELSEDTKNDPDTYSLSDVAEHGSAESCWSAIDGTVYDLTEFIEEHPGGSRAILVICGSDGSGSFNSMPAAVMPAARLALAKYKIGTLAE